ncbi:NAD-dependent epimerase [Aureimonas endophytica]|uniref:NAD-dependent epimerase n=1 Tax=Aureimonas endophytica TaxID=2027858 RepID=A0A917E6R1_9HYPH|nr:NAD-dependent epimerase/dehydratase family protein [Aureimonas endophytica]GGE10083.1 NAD-dependent epimerase [Aureimonas endophytica]
MRVLVSGAGGFVGRHLVPRLRAAGHDVVALRRGAAGGDSVSETFAGPADLAALDDFPAFPEGIEAIIHLGALNPQRGDPRRRDLAALRHANVAGTAALARRARREGVSRMILLGSASVHEAKGTPAREDDPLRPQSPYAISKAEAESSFRAGFGPSGTILRPAAVFGPGCNNAVAALARLAATPLPLPLGGLARPRSLVSVDSLADVVALCLASDAALGETFLVADDAPLTPADIVSIIRHGHRKGPRILPAPRALAGLAARLAGRGDTWRRGRLGLVLDTGHVRSVLGWVPGNARDALRLMVAEGRF